ncbi:hypothetical protein [Sedimenticola hydrogenitrophicus]|uniref:hypothetical protein n=1 Tax=Sedimenticola hydrogenitrophicus TaxID=2967975 RepID=UPI0023AE8995|nr:hypothetical protein [Sedimenticola hydrogenitrophicus]
MKSVVAWKIADALVVALIALVIGLLFPWWAGAIVLALGFGLVFRPGRQRAIYRGVDSEDGKSAKDLVEWNEWEVTHGPSAPGIANPSRRDD